MCLAVSIQPALNDLDTVKVAAFGVLHGGDQEGRCAGALAHGWQVCAHRYALGIPRISNITCIGIIGRVMPATKKTHR